MSYTQQQITENNANSQQQVGLADELANIRREIDNVQNKLAEMKATEKHLESLMNSLRHRNNAIAEAAGIEAPAPSQKATKGWWSRVRSKIDPPFDFEGIPGNKKEFEPVLDEAKKQLCEATKVLTALKTQLGFVDSSRRSSDRWKNNFSKLHCKFFEDLLQICVDHIVPRQYEVSVNPVENCVLPSIPRAISEYRLFRLRYAREYDYHEVNSHWANMGYRITLDSAMTTSQRAELTAPTPTQTQVQPQTATVINPTVQNFSSLPNFYVPVPEIPYYPLNPTPHYSTQVYPRYR